MLGRRSASQLRSIAAWVASGRRGVTGVALYSLWRLELERALTQEIADITLLAMGHTCGFNAVRARRTQQQASRSGGFGGGAGGGGGGMGV